MMRAGQRRAAMLVGTLAATSLLAACGGPSPYCAAVEKGQKTLDSFGSERTDQAFTSYAATMKAIAAEAPASVKDQWTQLATVTDGVIATHRKIGIKLEDMGDEKARDQLSEGDVTALNKAYAAFNDTQAARKAVVADVQDTCDVKLK